MMALVVAIPAMVGVAHGEEGAADEPDASSGAQRVMISSGLGSNSIAAQHPKDAVWLDLEGDDTGLALFEPEQVLPAKGALVMLADEGESAASELLAALATELAGSGWAVMTLGLEAPPFGLQQAWQLDSARAAERPEAEEDATPSDSVMIDVMDDGERDDLESRYRKHVQSMLGAATGDLDERGYGRVVVLGVGAASIHAARYAVEQGMGELVWIAPRFYPRADSELESLLAEAGNLNLLHVYSARRQVLTPSARELPLRLKKAGLKAYQASPMAIGARAETRDAGAVASRVRAWLTLR